ncbi:MAG: LLM class flavin-dependent oxidoreductase [Chloroflexota bacterium]
MSQLSIAFQTNKSINDYGPLAAQVEALGFDGVTVYNDMLYQPSWLPLLEMARHTKHIRLGPAAVNPFTSHPINIAGNIALLAEAAPNRTYLGLARGSWLDFVGVKPRGAITAVRDAIAGIRHLLHQDKAPFASDHFPLAGGDSLRWQIPQANIPFLLGTWGPKLMQACLPDIAEIKLGGTANPDVVPPMQAIIDNSEAKTGIVVGAVTVVDKDGAKARQLAKREVALYLPIVASLDPTVTIEPDRLAGLKAAANSYDFDHGASFVSDELLSRFAFAGTPDDIIAQTEALFAAGASRVEFGTPHGLTTESGLTLLGKVEAAFPKRNT